MKTKNFPGHRNARRESALKRTEENIAKIVVAIDKAEKEKDSEFVTVLKRILVNNLTHLNNLEKAIATSKTKPSYTKKKRVAKRHPNW